MRPRDFTLKIASYLIAGLVLSMLAASPLFAEEYFHETKNVGKVDKTLAQIEGLLFRLRSDAGVVVNKDGVVTGWADQSGHGNDFTANKDAKIPVRLVNNVVAGKPVLEIAAATHKPGGFRSNPITIDPAKGMTLAVLARVTTSTQGKLLAYGREYKTPGALGISLWSYPKLLWWRVNITSTVDNTRIKFMKSPDTHISGKGFILFVTRFDPKTHELSMYQNGVLVGKTKRTAPLAKQYPFGVGVEPGWIWSFGGDLLEALAYNRALSEPELRTLSSTLLTKYGLGGKPVSTMAPLLPYAYYPSKNQVEVAIALSPELLKKAGTTPKKIIVRILNKSAKVVATGEVPLDAQSRGQSIFKVPDFPNGEYTVEYVIGKYIKRSSKTFKRTHFPFEKTSYGKTHQVFAPFTPVLAKGDSVYIVGRQYVMNPFGCFDSVKSLDRELLADPIRLRGETETGEIEWSGGKVSGKMVYEDEAVFNGEISSPALKVNSKTIIQEDGCARVEMTLSPGKEKITVNKLWLEIPLKDSEVPLFHYIGDNGMRFNYGGKTPRGGKIEWYREKWDKQVPLRWKVVEPGSDDGTIWTSGKTRTYGNPEHRPFVPYIWFGQEKRGLAFFMENERGYETNYRKPLQKVIRKGKRLILQVEIFQNPVTITSPRTITFGLMASPGKPLEKKFRTRPFASGVGPVSCWGGWGCPSKYPAGHDWSIVDKIQEIRRRRKYTDGDKKWFTAKGKGVNRRWPGRSIYDKKWLPDKGGKVKKAPAKPTNWAWLTKHYARRAAEVGRTLSGTYFEEHATDPLTPEWIVFQDEWASAEFNRFRAKPACWGVFSASYHNFVLYMANEWMKRGVSLYFDNTNPKRCYNERFGPAFRGKDGALRYGITMFSQRRYYRRIYKLLKEWNQRGVTYPIDFTVHMTNTQTLPFNTWATATLDLEQRSYTEDPAKVPSEIKTPPGKKPEGYQLPWAADYTRTVTFGRQSGTIPLGLNLLSGQWGNYANTYTPAIMLRDWAMRRIHDLRPARSWVAPAKLAVGYEKILIGFGYGDLQNVKELNYWDKKSKVIVEDKRIKWLALRKRDKHADPFGLLLLQSYTRPDAVTTKVILPGAGALLDIETRELIRTKNGQAEITMPKNFSTRMFFVARKPESLTFLTRKAGVKVENFELPTPLDYTIYLRELIYEDNKKSYYYYDHQPTFISLPYSQGKRFLRFPPRRMVGANITYRDDRQQLGSNYEFSFRTRLPKESAKSEDRFRNTFALKLQFRYVPEDRKNKIPSKTLQALIRVTREGDVLKWWLLQPAVIKGNKQLATLKQLKPTPGKKGALIPLTETSFGEWADFGVRLNGENVQFLVSGKAVAEFAAPQVWSGSFRICPGTLLSWGKTMLLDITDLTIINNPKEQ